MSKTNIEAFAEHLKLVCELGVLTPQYIEEKAKEWAEIEQQTNQYYFNQGKHDTTTSER